MTRKIASILLFLHLLLGSALQAQQGGTWVQVEAKATLGEAQNRARAYAARLPDVAGFFLPSGWYAVALGPYSQEDAQALLAQLRAQQAIPADSFIAPGAQFRQQFWPVGVRTDGSARPLPDAITPSAPAAAAPAPAPAPATGSAPAAQPATPDESLAEASASEARLDAAARADLQRALAWAGFYSAAVDGAFGRGTRAAMEGWQAANGFPATGILTSGQRQTLLGAYNAPLEGMGLAALRDAATGIAMQMPLGVVRFAAHEPPFARFDPADDFPARVLLISQQGDAARLAGLYDILQTLEIMPGTGPRSRGTTGFEIEGMDEDRHSYAYAQLAGGTIKGFVLEWPAGDEERRARVLAAMRESFTPIDGVLGMDAADGAAEQRLDMIAGLAIRKPRLSRSGFFADADGAVVTVLEAVEGCGRVTLDDIHTAEVAHRDAANGIAVLRPRERLAPQGIAAFTSRAPRLQTRVAVGGYPYGGVLATPTLTFGTLADLRGLNGEEGRARLDLAAAPGDAGGPVLDDGGAVMGMLLPREDGTGRVLPADVTFSVTTDKLIAALDSAGIAATSAAASDAMPPETLTRRAGAMTVLVSCWD